MGVPAEKSPDVMALMGDSIDNIPGARDPNEKLAPGERRKAGIGEVGARQLIQQFGSAEETRETCGQSKTLPATAKPWKNAASSSCSARNSRRFPPTPRSPRSGRD